MLTTKKKKPRGPVTLAVDIGGSGIKVMSLDRAGVAVSKRVRIETPKPAIPKAVLKIILMLARDNRRFDRVSVGFPGVVRDGIVYTAVNLHPSWKGFHLAKVLAAKLKKPVKVANDADVQGLASIKGRGVELVVTLGTGIGSALFFNGMLVPNLELGHASFRHGETFEQVLGDVSLRKRGKKKWNKILRKAIQKWEGLFNYNRLALGGGNAKKIIGSLPPRVGIVSNRGGLIGGLKLWEK